MQCLGGDPPIDGVAVGSQAAVSNARPQSLALPKDTGELPDSDEIGGWRHFMLKLGGFYSRESAMQRGMCLWMARFGLPLAHDVNY